MYLSVLICKVDGSRVVMMTKYNHTYKALGAAKPIVRAQSMLAVVMSSSVEKGTQIKFHGNMKTGEVLY